MLLELLITKGNKDSYYCVCSATLFLGRHKQTSSLLTLDKDPMANQSTDITKVQLDGMSFPEVTYRTIGEKVLIGA